jgi:Arc/MetJ family transcription regulator
MRSNIIDIDVLLLTETEKAVRVAVSEEAVGVWLPKSLIEIERTKRGTCSITLPERIALEKGLI